MKKAKQIIAMFLSIICCFNLFLQTSYAAEPEPIDVILEPVHISEFGALPPDASTTYSYTPEGVKTQTKAAYLTIGGQYAGTVTLHYESELRMGRPQFIYETCEFTWDLTARPAGYYLNNPTAYYSNDYISITFQTGLGGLISDTITVGFYASSNPD